MTYVPGLRVNVRMTKTVPEQRGFVQLHPAAGLVRSTVSRIVNSGYEEDVLHKGRPSLHLHSIPCHQTSLGGVAPAKSVGAK